MTSPHSLPTPEYNRLHTITLNYNAFSNAVFTAMLKSISKGEHVTDLSIAWNT